MKKRRVTAQEALRALSRNREYQRAKREEDRKLEAEERKLRNLQGPLLAELRRAGLKLRDIWEMPLPSDAFPTVVLVLIKHLGRPYPSRVREGIARALAHTGAQPHWSLIRNRMLREEDPEVKWSLADALAISASSGELPALVDMLQDQRLGNERVALLKAVVRLRYGDRENLFRRLHRDPVLKKEISRKYRRFLK